MTSPLPSKTLQEAETSGNNISTSMVRGFGFAIAPKSFVLGAEGNSLLELRGAQGEKLSLMEILDAAIEIVDGFGPSASIVPTEVPASASSSTGPPKQ
jgi:hypothetical protein